VYDTLPPAPDATIFSDVLLVMLSVFDAPVSEVASKSMVTVGEIVSLLIITSARAVELFVVMLFRVWLATIE
jgi:hypothetical protein